MILLDSYALIALARDEPAAAEVEALLRDGSGMTLTSVNLFEVIDHLVRRAGWPEVEVWNGLSLILGEGLRILPVDAEIAWRGASLRARHYSRNTCEVSLADCLLLASARVGDSVATADPSIAFVARAESIELVPLPDSRGQRP